uniref:SFRICE_024274 n=1 Tax=Spodoptera frugiperda TaxID=7108 RepID=A0A2H1VIS7_SPOFR
MQRHALYSRRGRQRCSLRHVMPLFNTPCYYIMRNFRKTRKKPSNTLPDPGIEPETFPVQQLHLRPLNQQEKKAHFTLLASKIKTVLCCYQNKNHCTRMLRNVGDQSPDRIAICKIPGKHFLERCKN